MWTLALVYKVLMPSTLALVGLTSMAPNPIPPPLDGTWYCARARGINVGELYYSGTAVGSWWREPGLQSGARVLQDGEHLYVTPMRAGLGQLRLWPDATGERLDGQWHLRGAREWVRCARSEADLGWPLMLPGGPPNPERRPA